MLLFIAFISVGLMQLEARSKAGAVVLMIWGAVYAAGVLLLAYRRGAALLILTLHATAAVMTAFLAIGNTFGVQAARAAGLALLFYLLNAAVFVVGLARASRAEAGGTSLVRLWASMALLLGISILSAVPGGVELRAVSLTFVTVFSTVAGINIIKGGDRGFRLPSRSFECAMLILGGASLCAGLGWVYVRWLVAQFGTLILGPMQLLWDLPVELKAGCFVLIVPLCEEILFRGAIQGRLRLSWGVGTTILVSAAVFALGHLTPMMLPWLFLTGAVLGAVRERTGSLLPGFLIHAAINAASLLLLPLPGRSG